MRSFPPTPDVAEAPADLFAEGHLWLYEWVDGVPLRFSLTEYGTLRFGDRERTFDPDDVPLRLRHAARHVRERLDRDALLEAVDDPTEVTVFGVATVQQSIDYDWARLPAVLVVDVWDGERGQFLSPEAVASASSMLGLEALAAVEREVNTRDFDPDAYALPASQWYDGPAAGVLVRNKRGGRALLDGPDEHAEETPAEPDATPAELARRHATDDRLARVVDALESAGRPVDFDAVYERLFEVVLREEWSTLGGDALDARAFRAELADVVGEALEAE